MNRRDLTTPDAGGEERRVSGSPSGEAGKVEKNAPDKSEVARERPSARQDSLPGGRTRVVLLPVDPSLIHVYWRLAPPDLEKVYSLLGQYGQQPQALLKFHDVTDVIFDGANAHSSFDINIDLGAGNWYVHLWSPGKSYCVDLGFRTEASGFLSLARSNVAHIPPAQPSTKVEERYTLVSGDLRRPESVQPPREYGGRPTTIAWTGGKGRVVPSRGRPGDAGVQDPSAQPPTTNPPGAAPAAERVGPPKAQPRPRPVPARLVDWSITWLRKLVEIYSQRFWAKPPSRPTPPPPDLTEASEKKFTSGLPASNKGDNRKA